MTDAATANPSLHCRQCGYALAGLHVDATCPECGIDVQGSITPEVIEFDAECVKCRYSLFGLTLDGRCPECGLPIARSVHGDLLRFSSLPYVTTLHRGVNCVLASILGMILLAVMGFVIGVSGLGSGALIAASGLSFANSTLGLVGWWMLTTPDPRISEQSASVTARIVIRVALVVVAAWTLLDFVSSMTPGAIVPAGPATTLMVGAGLIAILIFATHAVKYFAALIYIGALARRVPDRKAQRRARTLMWLGPVLTIVGAFLLFIGPLIAIVLYYNLLDSLRKHFKRTRRVLERAESARQYGNS